MLRQLDREARPARAFSAPRSTSSFVSRALREPGGLPRATTATASKSSSTSDSGLHSHPRPRVSRPELAEALNREIISISERFINESSHRLAREQMAFAESELEKARHGSNAARVRCSNLSEQARRSRSDGASDRRIPGVTVELQASLARQEAELKGLLSYLNEDTPPGEGARSADRRHPRAARRSRAAAERRARDGTSSQRRWRVTTSSCSRNSSSRRTATSLRLTAVEIGARGIHSQAQEPRARRIAGRAGIRRTTRAASTR